MFRTICFSGLLIAALLAPTIASAQMFPIMSRSGAGCGCDVAPSCCAPSCGAPACSMPACGCEPACGFDACCSGPRFPLLGRVLDRVDGCVTNGMNRIDRVLNKLCSSRSGCGCAAPSCSMGGCGCEPACGCAPACAAPACAAPACSAPACAAPMCAPSCGAPSSCAAACGCEPACSAPSACCAPVACDCPCFPRLANARDLMSEMLFSRRFNDCGCCSAPACGCDAGPSCGCGVAPSCGCGVAPSCGCNAGGIQGAPPAPKVDNSVNPIQDIPPAPPVDSSEPTPAAKGEQARLPIIIPPVRVNGNGVAQPKLIRPSSLQQASPSLLQIETARPTSQWKARKTR